MNEGKTDVDEKIKKLEREVKKNNDVWNRNEIYLKMKIIIETLTNGAINFNLFFI